ncbi:MAG TPA: hypothetical protein VL359_18040 [bacterium]|nr:hypothetical protein [bacterium]
MNAARRPESPSDARFYAVDLGSNAVRMLVADVIQRHGQALFREHARMRVPVRLGHEAFVQGRFSRRTWNDVLRTMAAFRALRAVFHAEVGMGCATSAMREAENGPQLVRSIRRRTGMPVAMISGAEEADLVFSAFIAQSPERERPFLLFDLGGGSTEVAFYRKGRPVAAQSFAVGAVRLLERRVQQSEWRRLHSWVEEIDKLHGHPAWQVIGSGGNVKDLLRLSGKKSDKALSRKKLLALKDLLRHLSVDQRIHDLKLGADRADVILPACDIILSILEAARARQVFAPRIGLLEGMISRLYQLRSPWTRSDGAAPVWL